MSYTTEQLKDIARQKARDFGVNEDIFLRLVQKESSWNPKATSEAGAMGLVQLMPGTAKGLGVSNPYDPVQSLTGGARYLAQQLKRFGNYEKALAAYNAGPGNVEQYGGIPPFKETQNYVKTILGEAQATKSEAAKAPSSKVEESSKALDKNLLSEFIELINSSTPTRSERGLAAPSMPTYEETESSGLGTEADVLLNVYRNRQASDKFAQALQQDASRQLQRNLIAADQAKAQLLAEAMGAFQTPKSVI